MTDEPETIVVPAVDLPEELRVVRWTGEQFARSGYFPDARASSAAITKILAGREYGLGPMQSMNGFHIVKGKPGMHYTMIAALVERHPTKRFRVKEQTPDSCRILWQEREEKRVLNAPISYGEWEDVGVSSFTLEQAKKAGVVKDQSPWITYPEVMCFARALSIGARMFAADVFFGPMYELESGELAEVEHDVVSSAVEVTVPDETPVVVAAKPEPTKQLASPSQRGALWAFAQKAGLNRGQFVDVIKKRFDLPSVDRLEVDSLADAREAVRAFGTALRAGVDDAPGQSPYGGGKVASREPAAESDGASAPTQTESGEVVCSVPGCEFAAVQDGLCFGHLETRNRIAAEQQFRGEQGTLVADEPLI